MADDDRPEVPQYQPATVAYQPMDADDYANMYSAIMKQQIKFAPKILQTQIDAQTGLSNNAARLLGETARTVAPDRLAIEQQYQPQFTAQMLSTLQQADPEYTAVHKALGANVLKDLEAGYSLGPELQREVEQSIRAGQDARGNWLGAAPTAQEAFGTGSAAVNLYNQRMSTALNFQNSKSPTDFFGSLAPTSAWSPSAPIYPNSSVNSAIPGQVFGTVANSQAAYNSANIAATNANNQAMYTQYGHQWGQYGYDQAVANGLFNPAAGGSGANPWMGAASGAMSGAAMGTMVMPGWGTAIGAVGGAVLGGVGSM